MGLFLWMGMPGLAGGVCRGAYSEDRDRQALKKIED